MKVQKELKVCPIGLSDDVAKQAVEALYDLLASTYLLSVKTQNYHWNVVGPSFHSLHELFEEQYNEYGDAIDDIAERVRQLGYFVQASSSVYSKYSVVQEEEEFPNAQQMIERLLADHEALANRLRADLAKLEDLEVDVATCDVFVQRISVHDKAAWMLRSHLSA